MIKKPAGGLVVSTETAVKGMFRDLGKERMTRGVAVHDFYLGLVFNYIPLSWINGYIARVQAKGKKE
jgi:hypothetical protein